MVNVPASSISQVKLVPQAPEYNTVASSVAGVVASAANAVVGKHKMHSVESNIANMLAKNVFLIDLVISVILLDIF